jgi:hypothetical protein
MLLDFHISAVQHSTLLGYGASLLGDLYPTFRHSVRDRLQNSNVHWRPTTQRWGTISQKDGQLKPTVLSTSTCTLTLTWEAHLVLVNNLNVEGGCYSRINTCECTRDTWQIGTDRLTWGHRVFTSSHGMWSWHRPCITCKDALEQGDKHWNTKINHVYQCCQLHKLKILRSSHGTTFFCHFSKYY